MEGTFITVKKQSKASLEYKNKMQETFLLKLGKRQKFELLPLPFVKPCFERSNK